MRGSEVFCTVAHSVRRRPREVSCSAVSSRHVAAVVMTGEPLVFGLNAVMLGRGQDLI